MRLNILINRHRKKGKDDPKDLSDIGKFAWATPAMIVLFLKGSIEKLTPKHEIIDGAAQGDDAQPVE